MLTLQQISCDMSALDRQLNTRLNVIYGLVGMNNAVANLVTLALFRL